MIMVYECGRSLNVTVRSLKSSRHHQKFVFHTEKLKDRLRVNCTQAGLLDV